MHTILAVVTFVAVWAFITAHQLAVYYALAVMIGQLPTPDQESGKFYRWFFGVSQFVAANWVRAKIGVQGGGKTP